MPLHKKIVIATVNGRAYFRFTDLLSKVGMKFENLLPWDRKVLDADLLLTTRDEVPKGFRGKLLLYEELGDDQIFNRFLLFSRLRKEDVLLIGVDPGKNIGVACIYAGFLVWEETFGNLEEALAFLHRLLDLPVKYHIVRIGDGLPEMAEKIASELSKRLDKADFIEIVDERGTTGGRKRSEKDVRAAYRIAVRKGREYG